MGLLTPSTRMCLTVKLTLLKKDITIMTGDFLSSILLYLVLIVIAAILLVLFLSRSSGRGRRPSAHTKALLKKLFSQEKEER